MEEKKLATPVFVKTRYQCDRGIKLNDGRIVVVVNPGYLFRYDTEFELNGSVVTLNQLIKEGLAERDEVHCYDEWTIYPFGPNSMRTTGLSIRKVQAEFAQHGFNVSREAIKHNYEAWLSDQKSGYRDEDNNYHLFTPCGCNPLSFMATTLESLTRDWQDTYEE